MSTQKELKVKVITGSKIASVKFEKGLYIVRLTSQPERGKANKQLITLMAKHFGISKSSIRINAGLTSRYKKLRLL